MEILLKADKLNQAVSSKDGYVNVDYYANAEPGYKT